MDKLIELLDQIQQLAGVGKDALKQAAGQGGAPHEGRPEGGPPHEGPAEDKAEGGERREPPAEARAEG